MFISNKSDVRVVAIVRSLGLIVLTLLFLSSSLTAQSFTKITTGEVVNDGSGSRSVCFVDVNSDGWADIFITSGQFGGADNRLYLNNTDGTFSRILSGDLVSDLRSSDGAAFADYDNDGRLDAMAANWYGQDNLLYHNDGTGSWEQILSEPPATDGGYSEAGSWSDFDNDGDLDLFVANSAGDKKNFLYENDGQGHFVHLTTGVITTDNAASRCGVWGDYDNDGDDDLFVANEGSANNYLYENIGSGTFTKITTGAIVTSGGDSWGASWGDYDNDGDLDLFVANNSGQNNFLYKNNGDKTFTDIFMGNPVSDPSNSVGSSWIDYDNDGDLDLYVANGWSATPGVKHNNLFYENDGAGSFTKITGQAHTTDMGWSYGCGWGDYDNDGDLDLMVARWYGETEDNTLYRNDTGSANSWVSIDCIGTTSNNSAIGAVVRLKATIGGNPVWQMRQVTTQAGYCSQNSLEVEFGLGDATSVDSIVIGWPSGETDQFIGVSINQRFTAVEGAEQLCGGFDSDRDGRFLSGESSAGCPEDNCDNSYNPDQADWDLNGVGDVCDDFDGDGVADAVDNCVMTENADQADINLDGIGDACCCLGGRGNANDDPEDKANVSDVSYLVSWLFGIPSGPAPLCITEANANGDAEEKANVSDVSYLVSWLFGIPSGPAPPVCP